MTSFDRDDMNTNLRPERSYPISAPNHTPAWIAGVVIVAAIIGLFAYGSGNWGTHPGAATTPTHEMTQTPPPPPVNPAPQPETPKP
jgi:hypothetical protein